MLALLSDLHSNLHALEACLADARARGATQYAFLGDLVGYGAQPQAVVDRVMDLVSQGAWALRGNHDAVAVAPPADTTRADSAGAAWSHAQLSAAHRDFLASLPLTQQQDSMLLVHASAHQPAHWHYVDDERSAQASLDAADETVCHIFGGHVHHQQLFYRGNGRGLMRFTPRADTPIPVSRHRRWVATVGSVGQPRDGRSDAMYALFDNRTAVLRFLRVPYDHAAAAQAIVRAGLPAYNAERLKKGV